MMRDFFAGWLACLLLASAATAAPTGLEHRLLVIRDAMSGNIAFREERHSPILARPAVFEGMLSYDRDANVMRKQVESPQAVSMTVDERYVSIERDGKLRRIRLRSRPELRALLAGFRGLLTGDTAQLEKHFELAFIESGDTWELRMTPRSRRLASHVEVMIVDGTESRVTSICTRMTNGDWQHMTLAHQTDEDGKSRSTD